MYTCDDTCSSGFYIGVCQLAPELYFNFVICPSVTLIIFRLDVTLSRTAETFQMKRIQSKHCYW